MNDYEKWTVKSLRSLCKERDIKIPAKYKKADIVSLIENKPENTPIKKTHDKLTQQRQDIIKRVLKKCRKDGVEKILDYFEKRKENKRLKQVFIVHKLNLQDPSTKEIRICLKYYQELYDYSADEKLLINQMITQPKYIDPEYVDPRLEEFKQFRIVSKIYDSQTFKTSSDRTLNPIMKI